MSQIRDVQICDKYNKRSLMGNWYEERLNVSRDVPVTKNVRKVEPNFSFEHTSGIHDLDRLTRFKMPTQDIITNSSEKKGNYTTTMKQSLAPIQLSNNRLSDRRNIVKFAGQRAVFTAYQPDTVQISYTNRAKIMNPNNYSQIVSAKSSPRIDMDKTSHRNEFITTYMQGYNQIPTSQNKALLEQHQAQANHTKADIMNSLPLGKGEWSLKPNTHEQGYFRHMRSEVTNRLNQFITNK